MFNNTVTPNPASATGLPGIPTYDKPPSRADYMPSERLQRAQESLQRKMASFTPAGQPLVASMASAAAVHEENPAPQEKKLKTTTVEEDAMMEDDDEELRALKADFDKPDPPAVNVGKKLSVVDEDGKLRSLVPRKPEEEKSLERLEDPIDFTGIPENRQEEFARMVKAKRELEIRQRIEKMEKEKRLAVTAKDVQNLFNDVLVPIVSKMGGDTADQVDPIQMSIEDSIGNNSVRALNGMQALIKTVAKADAVNKETHSKMMKVHEGMVRLSEKNKYLQKIVKEKEERLKQMEERMREVETSRPLFAKSNERAQPKETPTPNGPLVKSEAKRGRDEESQPELTDTEMIIKDAVSDCGYWGDKEATLFAQERYKSFKEAERMLSRKY